MKNTLKKLLILSGLVICATSSFASPVNATNNIDDLTHQKVGAIFLNEDNFRIQYKNNSNGNFYYSNDQGVKDATVEHYQGNGFLKPNEHKNFSTTLETSLTSKGAKRQVYLYIPIISGSNAGKYKKVSFMVWTPHSGNPSWKLGTSNPDNPMDEDAYDSYSFHYDDEAGSNTGLFAQTKSWGVVQLNLEQSGLKVITYRYSNVDERFISNEQIIDTNRVQGTIVGSNDLPIVGNKPVGSYTESCKDPLNKNIKTWENGVLKQTCRTSSGGEVHAVLNYGEKCVSGTAVSNAEGNLTCDRPRDGQIMAASVKADAPKGTYDFGQWKADEYPVVYSPQEIHPFVTYNGKGYVACNGDTSAKDVPGKSDAWKEVNGTLGNTCGYTVHSYKKQSTTPSVAKSAVSFW